jgi:uncharacterized RDD family membrane protein YckC
MDWYYSDGRQQFGPVAQAEFDTLVASGRINAGTLVWRAGMANWTPFGTLQQTAPVASPGPGAVAATAVEPQPQTRFCSQCGRPFPPGDLLQIGSMTVCAGCKDVVMQRLREGALPGGLAYQGRQYGGFWIRFAAIFIDGIILGVVGAIINVPFQLLFVGMNANMTDPTTILTRTFGLAAILIVINMAIALVYESWFVVARGATPGKMVLSLEVIRADGTRPGWGLAIGRHFAKMLSSLTIYIGYIMAGFDDEKRALHDRICETRVVRK